MLRTQQFQKNVFTSYLQLRTYRVHLVTDENECDQAGTCPGNSECENLMGGFRCLCTNGYNLIGDQCQGNSQCQLTYPITA